MAVTKKSPAKKVVSPKKVIKKSPKAKEVVAKNQPSVVKPSVPAKEASSALHHTLKLSVIDTSAKDKGTIDVPKAVFGAAINKQLVAQAVRVYLANQREGSASTKTRGEVAGSTRKIYRQKGTGRARHGGIRAPIFVGGGITFGPHVRDYSLHLPDKMRRLALFSSLTQKVQEESFHIVDGLEKLPAKTKQMAQTLHTLANKPSILVITDGQTETVTKAARNIPGVTVLPAASLTTYAVVSHSIVICMKQAVAVIADTFIKN